MDDPAFRDFAHLVRRMRARQKEYFRKRDQTVLAECRDLERRVDAALEALNQQPGLFGEPSP